MVFWCPYFESRFPTVDFQISEMPIDLLGVGTDPLPGRFQLPTPNRSIGPSEVARDGFKAGCFRLPLVGGRFLNWLIKYCTFLNWHLWQQAASQGHPTAERIVSASSLPEQHPIECSSTKITSCCKKTGVEQLEWDARVCPDACMGPSGLMEPAL